MSHFILIFACLLLGIFLKKIGRLPNGTPAVLNSFVVNIAFPAVALLHIHEMKLSSAMLYPASMAWIVFVVGAVIILALAKLFKWEKRTTGALILTACLGNTSFVGFPLLEALFGHQSLEVGVIADQAGSFLVLSSLGLLTATIASSGKLTLKSIAKRTLTFTPFIVTLVAVLLRPIAYPDSVIEMLDMLGGTLVPVALVSIGYQLDLRVEFLKREKLRLGVGLFYKLILALFVGVLHASGQAIQITIAEAAMAPMITGAIVAEEYGLNSELSTLMVGIGIPLSLLTVPIWAKLLEKIGV